jgi:hypothetical protein
VPRRGGPEFDSSEGFRDFIDYNIEILHFRRAHHEAPAMDVYNDGKRIVGPDRAISQNPDRFRAKRTLDLDLARREVGQVWYWNEAQQRERIASGVMTARFEELRGAR